MKQLLIKGLLMLSIVVIIITLIVHEFRSGYADPFYIRLTTPKASSMITGTSRAAQGIKPKALDSVLVTQDFEGPFQNFAFTLGHSPYGELYYNLIKKKIRESSKDGKYIVAVDPWALSFLSKNESNIKGFRESKTFVNDISQVDVNPNLEYLFYHYNKPYYKVFFNSSTESKLHEDGWLELNIDNSDESVIKRQRAKLKEYKSMIGIARLANLRINYLEKTIKFLKEHGKVYMVRVPVSKEFAEIEKVYAPDFDKLMLDLATKYQVPYLNYINDGDLYQTTDGNHLYKTSSQSFTERLAIDILYIETKDNLNALK